VYIILTDSINSSNSSTCQNTDENECLSSEINNKNKKKRSSKYNSI